MIKNLASTFVRKALYGALGALAVYLYGIAQAAPPAESGAAYLWKLGLVPLVTGAAALLTRLVSYDATKAAKR